MSWGWQRYPVTRLRPTMTVDGHGNTVPDYSTAARTDVGAWLYAPAGPTEALGGTRVQGVKAGGNLYGPPDVDVAAGDAVEFDGNRYRIVGHPQTWRPGTVLEVERWDG